MRDESKFMPQNPADMEEFRTRMTKAGELLTEGIKATLSKVESETQIRFVLGLDKDNPYAILPTWHPQNLKAYAPDETSPAEGGEGSVSAE